MRTYLDFEKPIAELESKVAELKVLAAQGLAGSYGARPGFRSQRP